MEINKNLIKNIKKIEEEIKLENLFTAEELIDLTKSNLKDNLELYNNEYIKSIDRTIDDLYLLYSESVKTRYLLIATCTFSLLKHYETEIFISFQENNASNKRKSKSIRTFFKEVSDLEFGNIELRSYNNNILLNDNLPPTYVSEYIIKLTEELFFLMPLKMSEGFKELNSKILQKI
ncbi:hypothetical protein [Virgibacillus sp. SK37]|uniref:hypothetical protein n=1 Tax=Virgibacillus sp. SK37 TaxID=403957 RepID=UPI0004D179AF|nr:hypothetical protein [Virgibacillus sp. SK37]AIF45167.1 hypothetical protein X953_03275 [Virgibacillus sp. SK37]